jgi:hypothetical protein
MFLDKYLIALSSLHRANKPLLSSEQTANKSATRPEREQKEIKTRSNVQILYIRTLPVFV